MTLPPAQDAAAILRGFGDHELFCEKSLTIRNKEGIEVPLRLTPAQRKLRAYIKRQEDTDVPVRIIVLKARQVHCSVAAAAEVWRRCAFLEGQNGKVFAHLSSSTTAIFEYYLQFEKSYAPFAGIRKLRRIGEIRPSKSEGVIRYEGGGEIAFGSAENARGGRSKSLRYLHNSECAFWRDAETLRTGLLSAVPLTPGTMIIDESTANGAGGPFYRQWQAAMDPSNKSGWLGMFFAWHENPEYSLQIGGKLDLTDQEYRLMERYSLTIGQLAWRRMKIASDCDGDERRFKQEFPSNPEEAFLTSGRPVFDMGALEAMPVTEEWSTGEIEERKVGPRLIRQWIPRTDGGGIIHLLRKPVANHRYVIGVDVAQGIDVAIKGATPNPDYSCAQVLDRVTGEQVAVIRERLEPAPFADWVRVLHLYYNNAYILPEANGVGIAFIQELMRLGVDHRWVFKRRRDPDDRRPPILQELGFVSSNVTRPQLISALEAAIREQSINITHPFTLHECRMFITGADGKKQAPEGEHDDLVLSLALAVMALRYAPLEPLIARRVFDGEADDKDAIDRSGVIRAWKQ
jgi:hypothetical protein